MMTTMTLIVMEITSQYVLRVVGSTLALSAMVERQQHCVCQVFDAVSMGAYSRLDEDVDMSFSPRKVILTTDDLIQVPSKSVQFICIVPQNT